MKLLSMLVASLLLAGAAPPPPKAATNQDLRCFIVLAMLADSEDAETKQAGTAGTMYFLGKLDGRSPGLDIEAAVAAEMDSMTDSDHGPLLQSCGNTLKHRGDYLIAAGKALEERGK